jgi:hypothetical protein
MTNLAIARRDDALGAATVPRSTIQVAQATGGNPATESTASAALKNIATYIPTEVITLYLAALAAVRSGIVPSGTASTSAVAKTGAAYPVSQSQVVTVIVFAILTPVFVWIVYAGKVKTAGKSIPVSPRKWPFWEMVAATIAFGAWAFSLPDSPFTRFSWYSLAWASFAVLVVSTLLGLLAPIVQRTLKS